MLFRKKIGRIGPKIGVISTGSRGWNGELPKLSMESQLTAFIPKRPEAESILSHGVMVQKYDVSNYDNYGSLRK